MSTLHKVKAYFGMAPADDYDDEYYDDAEASSRAYRREELYADEYDREPLGYEERHEYGRELEGTAMGFRGGYAESARRELREMERPRFNTLRGATRGAVAMEPRRMAELFEEDTSSSPLTKITTLRPKDYSEARTIGERFREGQPVIMDLVSMDNADAKRLVDFAAGLAFALRGSFDKVATKVFLLSPAEFDVSAEERRRLAESGFHR